MLISWRILKFRRPLYVVVCNFQPFSIALLLLIMTDGHVLFYLEMRGR